MYKNYPESRFVYDKKRKIVWKEISRYLQRYIKKDSSVLELGSGYCDFINSIIARKKYALDKYINPEKFSDAGIISLFGDFSLLNKKVENESIDAVFASNFIEHLNEKELENYIEAVRKKLKSGGKLILIQPNYKLCYKSYFDDYTHVREWSDISLPDFLKSKGFEILLVKPRFLPFSMKSNLPKLGILIRIYLHSPIKPFSGQMLVIVKK